MKHLILTILVITTILFGSCKKDKDKKIYNCPDGYKLNCTLTECECPSDTHYEVGPFNSQYGECYPKGEYTYKAILYGNHCLSDFDTTLIDSMSIGLFKFNGSRPTIRFGGSITQNSWFNTGLGSSSNVNLVEHDNGQLEITVFGQIDSFNSGAYNLCSEMADKTESKVFTTYLHGISNEENTEMDIEIIYIDGFGVNIDTGYVHLWK